MQINRTSGVVRSLILALAGVCLFAGIASAQAAAVKGQFTLPFDAKWGGATLPAGDYTFTLDSMALPAIVRIETGDRCVALVMTQGADKTDSSKASELIVTRDGGQARIRVLHVAELGTDFEYSAPKSERREMASAPELIQRIPITFNGK